MSIHTSFYLSQRFLVPYGGSQSADISKSQAGYRGDYMGASEYEFGALQSCFKAMRDAKELAIAHTVVDGQPVAMLYVAANGDPTDDLHAWYGPDPKDKYARRCRCKASSHFDDAVDARKAGNVREQLQTESGLDRDNMFAETATWWAIGDNGANNVIFGFSDEPHFANFVAWINNRREAEGNAPVELTEPTAA
jgi:hypothetical protein